MIAIFAPYGRNEVTAAAIRLADVAVGAGLDVRLMATSTLESRVHPGWDALVRSSRLGGLYDAASRAECCVWFDCCSGDLDDARMCGEASHVLVPSWHALRDGDADVIRRYDGVVCPSKTCCDLLKARVHAGRSPRKGFMTWAKWDTGLPFTPRKGTRQPDVRKVLFACDAASIDACPQSVFHAVEQVLSGFADVAGTVLCSKTWCKRDRSHIRGMLARHRRLSFAYCRTLPEQAAIMQEHDWLVLPGIRSDFALTAMRGLACGLPVICYDVPPFNEQVVDGGNGCLVKCETGGTGWLAPPAALASAQALALRCCEALEDRQLLHRLQANDWHVAGSDKAFRSFWLETFGL